MILQGNQSRYAWAGHELAPVLQLTHDLSFCPTVTSWKCLPRGSRYLERRPVASLSARHPTSLQLYKCSLRHLLQPLDLTRPATHSLETGLSDQRSLRLALNSSCTRRLETSVLQITHLLLGDSAPIGLITVTWPQRAPSHYPEEIERTQFL